MTPRTWTRSSLLCANKAIDQQTQFVGGPLANRLQPPGLDERLAVKHAQDDIGIADVDR
jgi:hypothetical protein